MSLTLSDEVSSTELIFRGFVIDNWDFSKNKLSSSAFKDPEGLSVERTGNRTKEVALKKFNTKGGKPRFYGVASLVPQNITDVQALLVNAPSKKNKHHCEIHDSDSVKELNNIKRYTLSTLAVIECKENNDNKQG